MTFGQLLRETIKSGRPIKYVTCLNCGGAYGTLIKVGENYQHQRTKDCARHRLEVMRQQAKLKKEQLKKLIVPIKNKIILPNKGGQEPSGIIRATH